MNNFTVGDRCLVHQLQTKAGKLLNGQHVTLVKAIIEKGRWKCRFDDGSTIKQIKPSNLQKIEVDLVKQTTQQRHDKYVEDPCSICFEDVNIFDPQTFRRYTCWHYSCGIQLYTSEMTHEQKCNCPMCRSKPAKPGSKEDLKRLLKWSKRNRTWAQYNLGNMYQDGDGVKQNSKRAVELYTLAADQGDAHSQLNLGYMYKIGDGVTKDIKRAYKLYTLSAEQGHPTAQNNLGFAYYNGTGVEQSYTKAREWWTRAASQGHEEAILKLKQCYKIKGRTGAKYGLGCMYRVGQGVDTDEKRSIELITLAANQGHADAQYNLGCMYANGQGVDQSLTKARDWFTKAASQGNKDAIFSLKLLDEQEGRTTTSSSTVTDNTTFCSYCNKPEPTNKKFNRCKRCRSVFYCNRECQIKHWKTKPNGHKKQCKKLKALKALKKNKEEK